jgi:hypothetical protein
MTSPHCTRPLLLVLELPVMAPQRPFPKGPLPLLVLAPGGFIHGVAVLVPLFAFEPPAGST